jgi:hypothetical protein
MSLACFGLVLEQQQLFYNSLNLTDGQGRLNKTEQVQFFQFSVDNVPDPLPKTRR